MHELVNGSDLMCSDQCVATERSTVDATNRDWWCIVLLDRQFEIEKLEHTREIRVPFCILNDA